MTTASPRQVQIGGAADELRLKLKESLENAAYLQVSVGAISWVNEGLDPRFNVEVGTPAGLTSATLTFTEGPDFESYPPLCHMSLFRDGEIIVENQQLYVVLPSFERCTEAGHPLTAILLEHAYDQSRAYLKEMGVLV